MRPIHVLCVALALVASSCQRTPPTSSSTTAKTSAPRAESRKVSKFDRVVELVHFEYRRVLSIEYRTRLLRELAKTRSLSPADLLNRLEATIHRGTIQGADGLEPLLLADADAIARRGSIAEKSRAEILLRSGAASITFAFATPHAGFLVPLGREDSRLVVDVRSDFARALALDLLANPGATSFDAVIDRAAARDLACDLPPVGSQMPASEFAIEVDERRQNACRNGGGSQVDLSSATAGACVDPTQNASFGEDEYTFQEMDADMEECMNDLRRGGGGNTVTSGPVAVGLKVATWMLPVLAEYVLGKTLDELSAQRPDPASPGGATGPAEQARQALINAAIDYTTASELSDSAAIAANTAERAYDVANAAFNKAVKDAQDAGRDASTDPTVDQRSKDLDAARTKKTEADKAYEDSKTKLITEKGEALKKAEAAIAAGVTPPASSTDDEDRRPHGAACGRLSTFGKDPFDPLTLGVNRNGVGIGGGGAVDPRKVNPDPNAEPASIDNLVDLPMCGMDPTTLATAKAACDRLIHCSDESSQCSCGMPERSEAQLFDLATRGAASVCAATRCGEDQVAVPGIASCSCQVAGGTPAPGNGWPRPLPLSREVLAVSLSKASVRSTIPLDASSRRLLDIKKVSPR